MKKVNLCWFRRDLRLEDQAALYHALSSEHPVVPVFVFDTNILDDLEDKDDRRVTFIHTQLLHLQSRIEKTGSTFDIFHGTPIAAFQHWLSKYNVGAVYANHDYEPYARSRDQEIAAFLKEKNVGLHTFKDQVIFETTDIGKDNGTPYTVFTPYSRKWKAALQKKHYNSYPVEQHLHHLFPQASQPVPGLKQLGFNAVEVGFPSPEPDQSLIAGYHQTRDTPGIHGTSRLGVHLRFGAISIRQLVSNALQLNETFLNELIWREFFQMILWHFPQVAHQSFKPEYDRIKWRNNETEFRRWCDGTTGYPIVDAGMRELNATGYMHNRVRMITASFLTKHLLTDWRYGEGYFARKLLDYDLASNNGNWQWAAGCGCDAAPYFRIFNPYIQTKKFDKDLTYIRRWIPELDTLIYPAPVVEHETARQRALAAYSEALKK
ncbi:MAG TPA: deoxyribodipyrimidine photo-lyase [Chitinophaga sp.]|uniref:cryptochrome/photolyase family protein n=1 Tax=Chitinophaga sp. TaxID=1869181 RepID=UPI002C97F51F|nr:deoxyribodipyrimidine photo-lyase [Chitinophaga sp.]HVI47301.1 deoxyribodipyrimidine photo-lyase [Chitinophaga sp.]